MLYEVITPEQTCCGQPSYNSGYWDETKTLAKKFIGDFKGGTTIVSPSASCTGFIKNRITSYNVCYTKLLRVNVLLLLQAQAFKARQLITQYLDVCKFFNKYTHD